MKVLNLGLFLALLNSLCLYASENSTVVIRSNHREFTVPLNVLNSSLLVTFFKQKKIAIADMKGFLPADIELQLIKQDQVRKKEEQAQKEEQARQKALARKIRLEKEAAALKAKTIAHYLATGQNRQEVAQYKKVGFSIKQLEEHNLLQVKQARRSMTIDNNVIKIQTLSITNQLINNIEGLENIDCINRFALIDLSKNRIRKINFETLNHIHAQLCFPMTIELRGNPIKLSKKVRAQLEQLPMISILA